MTNYIKLVYKWSFSVTCPNNNTNTNHLLFNGYKQCSGVACIQWLWKSE